MDIFFTKNNGKKNYPFTQQIIVIFYSCLQYFENYDIRKEGVCFPLSISFCVGGKRVSCPIFGIPESQIEVILTPESVILNYVLYLQGNFWKLFFRL